MAVHHRPAGPSGRPSRGLVRQRGFPRGDRSGALAIEEPSCAKRAKRSPQITFSVWLEAETQERGERRERRRLADARFPALKRLDEFRFDDNPEVPRATIAALAEGSWISDRESVILIGDSGTGKTHLATALAICACQQGRRVRFTTLASLANELQEAEGRRELARVVGRYARTELVLLDELDYLALPMAPPSWSSRSSPSATSAAR